MEVVWTEDAVLDLNIIWNEAVVDNLQRAQNVRARILHAVALLEHNPRLGKQFSGDLVRRLVVAKTPCTILYEIEATRIVISAVQHTSRKPPLPPVDDEDG